MFGSSVGAMGWFDLLSGVLLVSVTCGIVAVLVWGVMTND